MPIAAPVSALAAAATPFADAIRTTSSLIAAGVAFTGATTHLRQLRLFRVRPHARVHRIIRDLLRERGEPPRRVWRRLADERLLRVRSRLAACRTLAAGRAASRAAVAYTLATTACALATTARALAATTCALVATANSFATAAHALAAPFATLPPTARCSPRYPDRHAANATPTALAAASSASSASLPATTDAVATVTVAVAAITIASTGSTAAPSVEAGSGDATALVRNSPCTTAALEPR